MTDRIMTQYESSRRRKKPLRPGLDRSLAGEGSVAGQRHRLLYGVSPYRYHLANQAFRRARCPARQPVHGNAIPGLRERVAHVDVLRVNVRTRHPTRSANTLTLAMKRHPLLPQRLSRRGAPWHISTMKSMGRRGKALPTKNAVSKVVRPLAGMGRRLWPAMKAVPKEMQPVANTPLIQYAVREPDRLPSTHYRLRPGEGVPEAGPADLLASDRGIVTGRPAARAVNRGVPPCALQ